MEKPNSSHNEQALWQMWREKLPFNRKNLKQNHTQPSASTFEGEQRKMGKSGEVGGKEGREVKEGGKVKKVGVRGERDQEPLCNHHI